VLGQVQCLSEAMGHSKDPPQMVTVLRICWQPRVSFLAVSREIKLLSLFFDKRSPAVCNLPDVLVH